jgi:hypothetical protein
MEEEADEKAHIEMAFFVRPTGTTRTTDSVTVVESTALGLSPAATVLYSGLCWLVCLAIIPTFVSQTPATGTCVSSDSCARLLAG